MMFELSPSVPHLSETFEYEKVIAVGFTPNYMECNKAQVFCSEESVASCDFEPGSIL